MTARETLDLCRSFAIETASIARLVELAEQRIPLMPNGCRGIQITDMPRGGNDATAAAIAHADGLEQWYVRQRAELVMLVEQVERIIGGLETWAKLTMRAYYIDAKTDSEVAALMGYSDRRRAGEARAQIVQKLEENP